MSQHEPLPSEVTRAIQRLQDDSLAHPDCLFDPHLGYSKAIGSFLAGLRSDSDEIKLVCATALGKLGRHHPTVLSSLERLLHSRDFSSEFGCGVARAIASLKTSGAAEVLGSALLSWCSLTKPPVRKVTAVANALSSMEESGAAALPHLYSLLNPLPYSTSIPVKLRSVIISAYDRIFTKSQEQYSNYTADIELQREILFRLMDQPVSHRPATVGDCKVLFDRTIYVSDDFRGARCLVLQRPSGAAIIVAADTPYCTQLKEEGVAAFYKLITTRFFPYLQSDVGVSVLLVTSNRQNGSLSRVVQSVDLSDALTQREGLAWSLLEKVADSDLPNLFGSHAEEVLNFILKPKAPPSPVELYFDSRVVAKQVEAEECTTSSRRKGPFVDYSGLAWEFSEEVRRAEPQRGRRSQRQPSSSIQYLDSLGSGRKQSEFPLPEDLKVYLRALTEFTDTFSEMRSHYLDLLNDPRENPQQVMSETGLFGPNFGAQSPASLEPTLFSRKMVAGEILVRDPDLFTSLDISLREVGIVVLQPHPQGRTVVSNVPVSALMISNRYAWHRGSPLFLAINVLNHFVPPYSDGLEPISQENEPLPPYRTTMVSRTAAGLADSFKVEILEKLSPAGGFISARRIKDWILEQKTRRS